MPSGVLPGWDYFTPVQVERELTVDMPGLRADCGLPSDARVSAVLGWHSSLTGIRGAAAFDVAESDATIVRVELEPTQLGGSLTLQSKLVLATSAEGRSVLSPHRAGCLLWSEETRIILEGEGHRFPILPLDFISAGIGGGRSSSGWYLEGTNEDLSSSGVGSLRLLVNTSNPVILNLLTDPGDIQAVAIQQFMQYDVYRQLVMAALHNDDLLDGLEHEAGTLGELLATTVRRIFDAQRLDSLRGDYSQQPGEFEALLQARLRFLDAQS